MKINTPAFMMVLWSLSLVACSGVNSPTTADSTTLYTGPLPKALSPLVKDTSAEDSLKMGPDNFPAKDTTNRVARARKTTSTE